MEAIRRLRMVDPPMYLHHFVDDLIPVRVLEFDADVDPDLAWKVEVAENEKRRDYTAQEIQAFRERLLTLGFVEKEGRPKKGEESKNLNPALAAVIGKSIRTVRRILNEAPLAARSSEKTDAKMLVRKLLRSLDSYQAAFQGLSEKPKGMNKANAAAGELRTLLIEALGETGN